MMRSLKMWGLAGAAALPLACSTPPENTEDNKPKLQDISAASAALTANENIALHVTDMAETMKAFEKSGLVKDMVGTAECPESAPGVPGECVPVAQVNYQEDAKKLSDWLKDHVFTEANVEASLTTPTSVTFRLKANQMCEENEGTRDADCVKFFDDIAFRIAVTMPAAGNLAMALTVDAASPGSATLNPTGASITANLPEIRKVIDILVKHEGNESDLNDLPDTIQGSLKLSVTREAEHRYAFVVGVLSAISVGDEPATSLKHWLVSVAASQSAVSFKLDGDAKKVLGGIDFNAIDAEGALNLLFPRAETCTGGDKPTEPGETPVEPVCTKGADRLGQLALHLGGISASGDFDGSDDKIAVTNLGVGNETSTVKYNGTQILAFDLNKDAGRRFAAKFDNAFLVGDVKRQKLSVSPSFAAYLTHDFTAILPQMDEDIPAWAKVGFADVKFDGAAEPYLLAVKNEETATPPPCDPNQPTCEATPPPAAPQRYLEIGAGKLTLAAKDVGVVVSAPMCVMDAPEDEESGGAEKHPFSTLAAGSCSAE